MISIAPMLDRTNSHYRSLMRLLTRHSTFYTEMVVASTLVHGTPERHLLFHEREHPLILQLASDNPEELYQAVCIAEGYHYDGYNLNIGCPSQKAQQGHFGVCQMVDPRQVAQLVRHMQKATTRPISIKHRIGIEGKEGYPFLKDFVATLYQEGIRHFIIHARIAILKNFSPKANRQIPPLQYEEVYRIKQDFPDATIEINGGIRTHEDIYRHLQHVDKIMIGREAYNNPFLFREVDRLFFQSTEPALSYDQLVETLISLSYSPPYEEEPGRVLRHAVGFFKGWSRAKQWRRAVCHPNRTPDMIRDAYRALAYIFNEV